MTIIIYHYIIYIIYRWFKVYGKAYLVYVQIYYLYLFILEIVSPTEFSMWEQSYNQLVSDTDIEKQVNFVVFEAAQSI